MSLHSYEILDLLGKGGFGEVYRGRFLGAEGFAKPVAIKVLNLGLDNEAELAARLRDEARMLGLVQHRSIVGVDRLVRLQDRWAVVMELVEGADLSQIIEHCGPAPVGPALEVVAEVAGALHAARQTETADGVPLNLSHRDIKPANIQITAMGTVKVLDFGVARAEFADRESETGSHSFGSLYYMSPERIDHREHERSDIYSLGVVLFQLLTGRSYGRTSAARQRHEPKRLKHLTSLREDLGGEHGDVLAVVAEMLAYEPARRPSAAEVERRCIELRQRTGGPALRYWAEDVVPAALAAMDTPEAGELSGETIRVGTTTDEHEGATAAADRSGEAGEAPPPSSSPEPALTPIMAPEVTLDTPTLDVVSQDRGPDGGATQPTPAAPASDAPAPASGDGSPGASDVLPDDEDFDVDEWKRASAPSAASRWIWLVLIGVLTCVGFVLAARAWLDGGG